MTIRKPEFSTAPRLPAAPKMITRPAFTRPAPAAQNESKSQPLPRRDHETPTVILPDPSPAEPAPSPAPAQASDEGASSALPPAPKAVTRVRGDAAMLRVSTVADLLDVSDKRVYELIRKGHLEAVNLGVRQTRVLRPSLETYLRSLPRPVVTQD